MLHLGSFVTPGRTPPSHTPCLSNYSHRCQTCRYQTCSRDSHRLCISPERMPRCTPVLRSPHCSGISHRDRCSPYTRNRQCLWKIGPLRKVYKWYPLTPFRPLTPRQPRTTDSNGTCTALLQLRPNTCPSYNLHTRYPLTPNRRLCLDRTCRLDSNGTCTLCCRCRRCTGQPHTRGRTHCRRWPHLRHSQCPCHKL